MGGAAAVGLLLLHASPSRSAASLAPSSCSFRPMSLGGAAGGGWGSGDGRLGTRPGGGSGAGSGKHVSRRLSPHSGLTRCLALRGGSTERGVSQGEGDTHTAMSKSGDAAPRPFGAPQTESGGRPKALVTVYMHGTPETPASEDSRDLVAILHRHGVAFAAHDISADDSLRAQVVQKHDWTTFPQMHVNGRLLGDVAIVRDLDSQGELPSEMAAFAGAPAHPPAAVLDTAAVWRS